MNIIQKKQKNKLVVRTDKGIHIIACNDIVFVKADNNYCIIYLKGQKQLLVCNTLKNAETVLKDHDFIRCHKSYLVNIDYINKILCSVPFKILLKNNCEIPVSREGLQRIKHILGMS